MPRDVWFTSDTHFGHNAIIGYCDRPFESVDEMNSEMIRRWNQLVKPDDIVWHLGDVGMGQLNRFRDTIHQLRGEKHLITGNHDEVFPGHRNSHKKLQLWMGSQQAPFQTVQSFARRRINGQEVLLSHFPYDGDHTDTDRHAQYRLKEFGLPLLHGHTHSKNQLYVTYEANAMIHVGVDAWQFRPVHIDEIAEML